MALINVTTFAGMRPALARHLLKENEAQLVYNASLENGELAPLTVPRLEATHSDIILSAWRHDLRHLGKDFVWRLYNESRQFVPSPLAGDIYGRVYMSTPHGLYFMDKEGKEYSLGVITPEGAPTFGSVKKRSGSVVFSEALNGFYFETPKKLYLAPKEKISFAGEVLPSGISADKEYCILEAVPYKDSYAFRVSEVNSEAQNIAVSVGNGAAFCTVSYEYSVQTRAYVYTLVNIFGDESVPSLPSSITVDISTSVTLHSLVTTQDSKGAPIAKKRIYRTVTGSSGNTSYSFVDEIEASENSYVDNKIDVELGEILPSLHWRKPEADMRHLIQAPNGIMAAHNNREIMLCEPYKPYAWAEAGRYSVQGVVQNIQISQRTVFVLTESLVHALTVDDNSAYMTTLDGFTPCLSADGVTSSLMGVFFPSSDGLYLVSQGMVAPQNTTEGLISEQSWRDMNPHSFHAVFFDTTYMAFFERANGERGALLLDFGNGGQAKVRMMDDWGTAALVVPGGRRVFYAKSMGLTGQSGLYEMFSGGSSPVVTTWRSKEFCFSRPVNMGAVIIEGDLFQEINKNKNISFWGGCVGDHMAGEVPFGEEESDFYPYGNPISAVLRVFADGILRATLYVRYNKFMRIPSGYAAQRWEFEISSINTIRRIALATSIEELQ